LSCNVGANRGTLQQGAISESILTFLSRRVGNFAVLQSARVCHLHAFSAYRGIVEEAPQTMWSSDLRADRQYNAASCWGFLKNIIATTVEEVRCDGVCLGHSFKVFQYSFNRVDFPAPGFPLIHSTPLLEAALLRDAQSRNWAMLKIHPQVPLSAGSIPRRRESISGNASERRQSICIQLRSPVICRTYEECPWSKNAYQPPLALPL
jgi:hypothetical protein